MIDTLQRTCLDSPNTRSEFDPLGLPCAKLYEHESSLENYSIHSIQTV